MPLRIDVLGTPHIEVDGKPLQVDTRKAVALLAYLAVEARPAGTRSPTCSGPSRPGAGRSALRRTLSTLRTALGGRWLETARRSRSSRGRRGSTSPVPAAGCRGTGRATIELPLPRALRPPLHRGASSRLRPARLARVRRLAAAARPTARAASSLRRSTARGGARAAGDDARPSRRPAAARARPAARAGPPPR